jgi:hypothetical protein
MFLCSLCTSIISLCALLWISCTLVT